MPLGLATKSDFQRVFRPATRRLADAGVSPNQVTTTTIVMSIVAGATVLAFPGDRWAVLLVPAVLCLRLAFNHIDGMLACEHDMKSPLGAILNELADVVSDAALYLPLALVPGVPAELLVPAVVLGVVAEMAGVVAIAIGADRREDGPVGKKLRGLIVGGSALAIASGATPGLWMKALFVIMLPLQVVTIINRVRNAVVQAEIK